MPPPKSASSHHNLFSQATENWSVRSVHVSSVFPIADSVINCGPYRYFIWKTYCCSYNYILHISSDIFIWPFKDLVNPTLGLSFKGATTAAWKVWPVLTVSPAPTSSNETRQSQVLFPLPIFVPFKTRSFFWRHSNNLHSNIAKVLKCNPSSCLTQFIRKEHRENRCLLGHWKHRPL